MKILSESGNGFVSILTGKKEEATIKIDTNSSSSSYTLRYSIPLIVFQTCVG